jgi:hypothetical protein
MLGVLAGWYLRKWYRRWKRDKEPPPPPPPEPESVYDGTVTLSHVVQGPLRRECRISEPLDDTGLRVILEDGDKLVETSEWVTTMKCREQGRITMRFQGESDVRDSMMHTDVGDEWRLEFYLVKKDTPLPRPAPWEDGHQAFGGNPGDGGF